MSMFSIFSRLNSAAKQRSTAIHGCVPRGHRNPLCSRLSQRFVATRNRSGQKLYSIAAIAELAQPTAGAIERGENTPALDTIERLAAALGVSPGWLSYGYEGLAPFRERRDRFFFEESDPVPDDALRSFRATHTGFADRLRLSRERSGLSMRALSAAAGVSVQAWSNAESGKVVPRVDTAERMAVALGVAPSWLAFGEGIVN